MIIFFREKNYFLKEIILSILSNYYSLFIYFYIFSFLQLIFYRVFRKIY